ncbi:MAG: hypothetical protein ACFE0I_15770 [Elainellaceae cyanobacterium]
MISSQRSPNCSEGELTGQFIDERERVEAWLEGFPPTHPSDRALENKLLIR